MVGLAWSQKSDPWFGRLGIVRLHGLTPYLPLWKRQQDLAAARARGEIGDLLLLLEHDHVYTNGRSGHREQLLVDETMLSRLGAKYLEVDRGGAITYHGPGQLVGYAIIDLIGMKLGVRTYVRDLERVLIRVASEFGVAATTETGYPGVWVGDEKLGTIGVKVSRGITYHGFALNVSPALALFRHIVPCGLADRSVTSLARLRGEHVTVDQAATVCERAFADVFGHSQGGEAWKLPLEMLDDIAVGTHG